MTHRRSSLASDLRGYLAVEFALISSAMLALSLGGFELAVLGWAESALQDAAALTARCVALSSTQCSNPSQYGATLAQNALFSGAVSSSEVAVKTATSCGSAAGSYAVVTISAHHWSGSSLASSLSRTAIVAQACYPVTK
jgi:Flp pilus assembly protein TadG